MWVGRRGEARPEGVEERMWMGIFVPGKVEATTRNPKSEPLPRTIKSTAPSCCTARRILPDGRMERRGGHRRRTDLDRGEGRRERGLDQGEGDGSA